ncbi:DUF7260 family protein [Halococcoides cellulosivorans]
MTARIRRSRPTRRRYPLGFGALQSRHRTLSRHRTQCTHLVSRRQEFLDATTLGPRPA